MSNTVSPTGSGAAAPVAERDGDVRLPDGRTLSYAVLGAPDASRTVVVLDGPGSRGLARVCSPRAAEQGVRLVAPDRPGFLRSTPVGRRTFAGVADDVLALADDLGAERFGILGQSGGTPYALALAGRAPRRAGALALVGAITPLGERGALEDVAGPMRPAFVLGRRAPFLHRIVLGAAAREARRDPERSAARMRDAAPEADRRVLDDPAVWAAHLQTTREALASPRAMADELRLLARHWDVDLGAVRCPVALWVGALDTTHPPVMARRLAGRLGGAPVHEVPGVATFGLLPALADAVAFAAR